MDLPGLIFVAAASFLIGLIMVDLFWDIRSVGPEPFTRETAEAITAFYTNNVVRTRRYAPYLIATMPMAFLVVIGSLVYKCVHGLGSGNQPAVLTSAVSMAILFPLIAIAAISTFPTIGAIVTKSSTLPLDERHRLHKRLFVQHAIYVVLTAGAIIAHVTL